MWLITPDEDSAASIIISVIITAGLLPAELGKNTGSQFAV